MNKQIEENDIRKAIKQLRKANTLDKSKTYELTLEEYIALSKAEDWANEVLGIDEKIL